VDVVTPEKSGGCNDPEGIVVGVQVYMKTNAQAFGACVQHIAFIAPGDLNPKAYPAKHMKISSAISFTAL